MNSGSSCSSWLRRRPNVGPAGFQKLERTAVEKNGIDIDPKLRYQKVPDAGEND